MAVSDRARQAMIDGQLRAGGVVDPRILARFDAIPREDFVPAARRALAYVDDLHWFGRPGFGGFMAAPAILGKLIDLAEVAPSDRALDIGATTGYATAILAGLAQSVVGHDRDAALVEIANANLAALAIDNARIVSGALDQFASGSLDVIIVQGMLDSVPVELIDLLREGGRLVVLIRNGQVGTAHLYLRAGGKITERASFNSILPLLPGSEKDDEFVF